MKTLYIVRHAKSSWDFPELSDYERPLNTRGLRNAPEMGKRLKLQNIKPDLVLTSPAKRALETSRIICSEIGYPENKVQRKEELYHADEDEILEVIQEVSDQHKSLMLFGHNPGLTFFVNEMTSENIYNIPTCGIVAIELEVERWQDLDFDQGKLIFFDYPKKKL